MERRLWLICYDIADDRRLRQVARVMERYGTRVQKSVFECWLDNKLLRTLQKEIARIIKVKQDSVRYYHLCKTCQKKSLDDGGTATDSPQAYYIA